MEAGESERAAGGLETRGGLFGFPQARAVVLLISLPRETVAPGVAWLFAVGAGSRSTGTARGARPRAGSRAG